MTRGQARLKKPYATLREFALRYPEAHEDFPWGETAVKVAKKAFVFMRLDGEEELSFTVKLPWSSGHVAGLPFAEPSGYGLGKSGWITSRFDASDDVPVDLLCEWIDESYRAVAPKKLVAALGAKPPVRATRARPVPKRRSEPASRSTPKSRKPNR